MAGKISDENTPLNARQAQFVREYLIDFNAKQASIRAGYSAHSAHEIASQLMEKPYIAKAIKEAIDARAQRTEVTQDRVLLELGRIAFFDKRKLYNADGALKKPHEWDDDTAAVLSGLDIEEIFSGNGEERQSVGFSKKAKVFDKVAALSLAMRHLGMLKDKIEHSGAVDTGPRTLSDAELDAAIAARAKELERPPGA
jgi:phage terminase small subunit